MKVLIVSSKNKGKSAFVIQQANSIISKDIIVEHYWIKGKGVVGYLKNLIPLRKKIKESNCDIIHAHYGLSGLLACLQNIKPVVVTFHGSDIFQNSKNRFLSFIASRLSSKNIFVHIDQLKRIPFSKNKSNIIPCGVDMNIFKPVKKKIAKSKMGLQKDERYILFSSHFSNKVKNYDLAERIINSLGMKVNLIELKDYSMDEVNLLLNGVDLLLVTSLRETGPMIVKEAMAANCPIVSNDVGDVKTVVGGDVEKCYVVNSNKAQDFVYVINEVFENDNRTDGRKKIIDLNLDTISISKKIIRLYNEI
ncbi:MAG: hypothetical protein CL714_05785 [Chloroflexi bacterium]|nr:hypothetical protein [Chloroflexota bacterium]